MFKKVFLSALLNYLFLYIFLAAGRIFFFLFKMFALGKCSCLSNLHAYVFDVDLRVCFMAMPLYPEQN